MNRHLSPDEFVSAIDEALPSPRQAHLASCESCRDELSRVIALVGEVSSVSVPEPSPLFWNHFSERVRLATGEVPLPNGSAVWRRAWKPLGAIAALAAAVALVVVFRPVPVPDRPAASVSAANAQAQRVVGELEEDGTWDLVVGLAAEADWADVRQVVVPRSGTADTLIDELTAEQREALVRLLQAEIGDFE